MGAVILPLMAIYLAFLVGATWSGWRWAETRGWKGSKRWLGAACGFLIVYLPVFWDWLPTVVAHKYYCEKEAGFWVYKTVEQWKTENPGVMEGLASYNNNPGGFNVNWPSQHEQRNDGHNKINANHINERFDEIVSWQDISSVLPIIRKENVLFDIKKKAVIARYVDFGTGNSVKETVGPPGPMKFWLRSSDCIGGQENAINFGKFYLQFKGTEK